MKNRFVIRLLVGVCFGLVAGLMAVAVGEAGSPNKQGPVRTDCINCHESVVTHWGNSAHGQAAIDPVFKEAWEEKGSPEECLACHTTNYDPETGTWETDGISCSVCHGPQTAPHPETAMPTDPSSRLCGTCHIDTHAEWEVSAHGEGELTCVRCHNPHTTDLKTESISELCTVCHNEEGHFYNFTGHARQNLSCTDCHMKVSDSPMGEGHGQRLHTFEVDLDTCSECHGKEMHFPVPGDDTTTAEEIVWSTSSPAMGGACEAQDGTVIAEEPVQPPTQPLNYLLIAAVGMGFGMAVTPFAEGWYRRMVNRD